MRYIYWFFVLLVALVAANFAVSNRDAVAIVFWPLPYTLTAPLYLALIAMLVAGFLIGRILGYLASVPSRRERNRLRVKTRELEAELSRLKSSPSGTAVAPVSRVA